MKDIKPGRQIIAILIAITALLHLSDAYHPISLLYYLGKYDGYAVWLSIIGCVFVMLNLTAAYGLFFMRRWGFGAAYAAIVYSSMIFKVGYIPFFDYLFPAKYVDFANILANIGILTLLISMQMAQFQPRTRKQKRKR